MLPASEVSGPNVVHYKDFNIHNFGLIVSLRRFWLWNVVSETTLGTRCFHQKMECNFNIKTSRSFGI